MGTLSRRSVIQKTGLGLGGMLVGVPSVQGQSLSKKIKIVVTGAHPDDPESGCGGFIALMSAAGHEVVVGYLTKGEAGISGVSHDIAAAIRVEEAKKACEILRARPVFLGQIDGSTKIDDHAYEVMHGFLIKEKPDMVLTHWPVDTHRDHRICNLLTYDAWLKIEEKPKLLYYEVVTGYQTSNFNPTNFIDISEVVDIKHESCFVHESQKLKERYENDHGTMEKFRGMQFGCARAEAFIAHDYHKMI